MPRLVNLDALDITTLRISQAVGVLSTILTTYNKQEVEGMEHILSTGSMVDALSAVETLLTQADVAAGQIIAA